MGRFNFAKNLESLIEALPGTGFGLDMVGTGEGKQALEQLVEKHGADVRFLGRIPQEELPAKLGQYRYFILPSRYEGMPKALLEAMACGLCCIGTEVTGIREVIHHGETGLLIPGIEANTIRASLEQIRGYDATALGSAARDYIVEHHSIEGLAKLEMAVMREIQA